MDYLEISVVCDFFLVKINLFVWLLFFFDFLLFGEVFFDFLLMSEVKEFLEMSGKFG